MKVRAYVYRTRNGDLYRAMRTLRSLRAAGIDAEDIGNCTACKLGEILGSGGPVLLFSAGTWLTHSGSLNIPVSSATGKGLCAVGALRRCEATVNEANHAAKHWNELFTQTGGDFVDHPTDCFPKPVALFLDSIATRHLSEARKFSLVEILRTARERFRFVHCAPLDVFDDDKLRVLQVITSLQRGGAERMTLDLMAAMPAREVRVRLATLGRPLREAFAAPPGMIALAPIAKSSGRRCEALLGVANNFGADLLHGHLINGEETRRLSAAGLPVMLTVHNTRAGWPDGLAKLKKGEAVLLVACAQAVESEIRAGVPLPVRTAWNGINLADFRATPERQSAGRDWRKTWGFGEEDFLLISVANPRLQKRLHLLPAVLAALRAKLGSNRQARLIFAGEGIQGHSEAKHCVDETRSEISRLGLEAHVRWAGSVADIPGILTAVNVLVSTSAHEGLSLAQIEALAMGCPVVTTEVGGAREMAWQIPDCHLLPADASAEQFAQVIVDRTLARQRNGGCLLRTEDWSSRQMAARYRWLYPRVIAAAGRGRSQKGIWLVANNFSVGGAQSSARRLLLGLADEAVRVRAAVIEEEPDNPTPGRRALLAAGVPVWAAAPAINQPPSAAVEALLAAIDDDPPEVVVFWNLQPSFKILLADALIDIPVYDVSPGAMYFSSLKNYFGKPAAGLPYRTPRDYGARLSGVIVKYQAEAETAEQMLGAPVHVVPNGVPVNREAEKLRAPESKIIFGTAVRINPQKRLEDLLESFQIAHRRLPICSLKIAGGVERGCESYAAELQKMSQGLPVEWLGECSDVAGFHRELDVFVMISEPAGCPNASLEAMAAGLPIIVTDVGGASEQVVNGRSGILVPRSDPQALADAMVELGMNSDLRHCMGTASRQLIHERFSVKRMVADYRRIFQLS